MQVERVFDWRPGEGLVERDGSYLSLGQGVNGAIRVGHLSDTHLGKGDGERRFEELRRWFECFEQVGVEVVIHTGDLVEEPGDILEVERAFSLFEEIGVPVFGVPGNHDVANPGGGSVVSERWGPFPRREEVGELGIWLLDSMGGFPADERADWEGEAAEEVGFYSRGAVGRRQLGLWEEQIRERAGVEGPEVVVVHHHLRQPVPEKPWYEENAELMAPLLDSDEVMDLAELARAGLILHGHRHQYIPPYSPRPGLLVLNGGSSTPERAPWRGRIIDLGSESLRVWEVVRW